MAKSRWIADRAAREHGFSLLEVLMATTVLGVGVVALMQLFNLSVNSTRSAKTSTMTTLLAEQKMEQLRALTWGFDPLGLPLSDTTTDTAQVPEKPTGGTGLAPSPAGALQRNTAGYCDFLDGYGRHIVVTAGTVVAPSSAVYVRRWSIEPLPTNPNGTIVLQVLVTRLRNRGAADATTAVQRLPDEARVLSVKTRKAT